MMNFLWILPILFHVSQASLVQLQLDEAKQQWKDVVQSLGDDPLDYNYGYEESPGRMYEVYVRDGTDVDGYSLLEELPELYTIDELYDIIQTAIDDGVLETAVYNNDYGFPSYWRIEGKGSGSIIQFTLFTEIRPQYEESLKKWNSLETNNYEYNIKIDGYFLPEFITTKRVKVSDGEIIEVLDLASGENVDLENFKYPTIGEAFEDIANAISDKPSFAVEAEFDEDFGYPKEYALTPELHVPDSVGFVTISNVLIAEDTKMTEYQDYLVNKAQWESLDLETYLYEYQIDDEAKSLGIFNDKLVSIDGQTPYPNQDLNGIWPTIEELFENLDETLETNVYRLEKETYADSTTHKSWVVFLGLFHNGNYTLTVKYNETFGYPNYMCIGYKDEDCSFIVTANLLSTEIQKDEPTDEPDDSMDETESVDDDDSPASKQGVLSFTMSMLGLALTYVFA